MTEHAYRPDALDVRILARLRDDARYPFLQIAKELGVAGATVHERVNNMRRAGLLEGYRAVVTYPRLGIGIGAYVGLVIRQDEEVRLALADKARAMPEVEEMAWLTGDLDALVKMWVKDTDHLERAVYGLVAQAPESIRVRTMVILSTPFVKHGIDFERILQE
ncbi:MAG: Lrp/AsnC family transcriptional regulator [Chloroflexota bacterium]|nr:Lrp/AsnC family transcriptional regulator [Chloroflexota bacterium]